MKGRTLFDQIAIPEGARTRDVSSESALAVPADSILSRTRRIIYIALLEHGPRAVWELEDLMRPKGLYHIDRRISELRRAGLIRKTAKQRRCRRTKRYGAVYEAVPIDQIEEHREREREATMSLKAARLLADRFIILARSVPADRPIASTTVTYGEMIRVAMALRDRLKR